MRRAKGILVASIEPTELLIFCNEYIIVYKFLERFSILTRRNSLEKNDSVIFIFKKNLNLVITIYGTSRERERESAFLS